MSKNHVRISRRLALELQMVMAGELEPPADYSGTTRILTALRDALASKRSVLAHAKRVRAKKASKREETADIRARVFERAGGKCDYCRVRSPGRESPPSDLEHALSRRVPQSVEVCLAVCRHCHSARTQLVGGAVYWWRVIADAFAMHGLTRPYSMARSLLVKHQAKAALAELAREANP